MVDKQLVATPDKIRNMLVKAGDVLSSTLFEESACRLTIWT